MQTYLDAPAFYFDYASPGLRRWIVQEIIEMTHAHDYDGIFFDTTSFESVHPEAQKVFRERHPGDAYDRYVARVFAILKESAPSLILYKALIPIDLYGLIAAGRSAVPRSPNFRQRCSMLLMGQAAGVAAGLCAKQNMEPRELDTKQLQRVLLQWDCPLGDKNRLAELGLV